MSKELNKILNLIKVKNFQEAKKKCDEVKNDLSKNADFLHIYGYIFFNLEDYDQAIEQWTMAVNINPKFVSALNNLGNAFSKLKKFDIATGYLDRALKLKPDLFEAYYTLSNIYFKKNMFEESLAKINQALKLKPDNLPSIKAKLQLFIEMNKKEESLKFLEKAIQYHPKNTELYNEKAQVLSDLGMNRQSLDTYRTILMMDPDFPFALGNIVSDKLKNCDWDEIDKDLIDIKNKINEKKAIADPFLVSTLFDSSELLNKVSKIWIRQFGVINKKNDFQIDKNYSKINIGYFSADFRDHPVGHLIVKMLETHNKNKFNIYGFYFGNKHKENDKYHFRLKTAFTKFYDVSKLTDEEILSLSKNLKIHIAVDLMTHTGGNESRFGIFLNKCAPIQINFLGYPGTSASDKMDYIIADKTVIPEKNKKFFTEKIIYLPNSYQPSEKNRPISNKLFSKEDLNLPEKNFIFCCFNTNTKFLPNTIRLWSAILKQVPKSVLWLISDNIIVKKNLKKEFEKRDIDQERIIFSSKTTISEHLVRIKHADLFLDTFPYNAHTSCSDSIWAGVPVVTLEGKSFQSRVASSLLNTSRLNELIAKSEEEYIEKAVEIAKNKNQLASLKEKLVNFKDSNPLFDNILFTNNIERAYSIALEKYFKRENPEDIYL